MHQHICKKIEESLNKSENQTLIGENGEVGYKPTEIKILKPDYSWIISVNKEFAFRISNCPFCGRLLPL